MTFVWLDLLHRMEKCSYLYHVIEAMWPMALIRAISSQHLRTPQKPHAENSRVVRKGIMADIFPLL
jgi:hypothetical protein